MAIGRLGAKGARLSAFVLAGDRGAAPVAVVPRILLTMRASAGPVAAIWFQGPALVYAVYGNGSFDQAANLAPSAGTVTWTNPNTEPIVGTTPRPGQRRAPNVLGNQLPPGPFGVSAVAVYFDDEGRVMGMQFNGPAAVAVQNSDGSSVQASNSLPSGTPARWANVNT